MNIKKFSISILDGEFSWPNFDLNTQCEFSWPNFDAGFKQKKSNNFKINAGSYEHRTIQKSNKFKINAGRYKHRIIKKKIN